MNNQLQINKDNVIAAYKGAKEADNQSMVQMLEALFGKETFVPQDIKERVKTFDDACNILTYEHPFVEAYQEAENIDAFGKDIKAFLKLRIITEALNEGWKPIFDGKSDRYYPWFYIYTEEEYNELSDEEKSRVVGRSFSYSDAVGGLVCASTNGASTLSIASYGSRLAFKSRELAEYCGTQFAEIWADFLFS